jgi:acyl-CoA dehydrogenase
MNFEITSEQRMMVDTVRAFMEKEMHPHEAEADRTGAVPAGVGERIKAWALEMGFHAPNLPESVGGGGLDYTSLALLERELGKTSYALHGHIERPTELLMACEGEQVERYLAPCVRGEKKECFALTEPGAGSDIMSMSTRAVASGDDYVINGTKHFISTVSEPDFAIVFASTGSDETPKGPRKRVTAFLVDKDVPGFEMTRGSLSAGQRAYPHYQLSFQDCRVNKAQMLGDEGGGFELANKWLRMGRVWVAAACCGRAERLLQMATEWAANRKQFGKPIGQFQGTSFKLADIATELTAADLMVMHAARKADEGTMVPEDAAMAKLFASEMVGRAADSTLQIFGGMGMMEDIPVERMWRDSRLDRIWDGTSEIQRHIIARSLLRPMGA